MEVQPRQIAPTSISVRNSPTPDAKPVVPERSVARKEPQRREVSSDDFAAVGSNGVNTVIPPRRDTSASRSHNASMPSLKEVDSYPNTAGPAVATRNGTSRQGHSSSSQKGSVSYPAAERHLPRKSVEGSPRSLRGPADTSPLSDKAGVQRVGSNSSKKSGSIHGRPSRGESESGQRPHLLRGRMSEEDRQRHFESLVNGEETVKFTLTPQTVRGLEVSRTCHISLLKTNVHRRHPRLRSARRNPAGPRHPASRSIHVPTPTRTTRLAPATCQTGHLPGAKALCLRQNPRRAGE